MMRRKYKIDFRRQIIIWFAGLRGAIAFVLAIELRSLDHLQNGSMLLSTTLGVVLFTTIVCGYMTRPLLKLLKLDTEDEPLRLPARKVRRFDAFDEKYIVPILCDKHAGLNETHALLESSKSVVGRRGFLFGALARHSDWGGAANPRHESPRSGSPEPKVQFQLLPKDNDRDPDSPTATGIKLPTSDSGLSLDLSYNSLVPPSLAPLDGSAFPNTSSSTSPTLNSSSSKYGSKASFDPTLQSKLLDD